MNIHVPENPSALDLLFHWVREREAIRIRKERGDAPPWTDDAVLRDWRFCNVRREDDRVTRWIAANIRLPFSDHPALWFMLCIARQINWPPTLDYLIRECWPDKTDFSPERLTRALHCCAAQNGKVFTGAYKVPAPRQGGEKIDYIAPVVLGALWQDRERFQKGLATGQLPMQTVHAALMNFDGWGPFLAYQAVVDMRFTRLLRAAPDVATWCAAGPGTMRGLNRLAGRQLDHRPDQGSACRELVELYKLIAPETGVTCDLSDVPNICCEVDKYLRVISGEGTPRARYVPGRGY